MYKKIQNHLLFKILSWLLIVAMLNLSIGCINYFRVKKDTGIPQESIENYYLQHKTLILHVGEDAWVIEAPEVADGKITAIANKEFKPKYPRKINPDRKNKYNPDAPLNESRLLNQVHIFASEKTSLEDNKISIDPAHIQKIEVYEHDKASTNLSEFLGTLGGAYLMLAGFWLVLVLTSCPYVYAMNGGAANLVGEIYSGSVQAQLERHDFLELPVYDVNSANYQILISNELKEIQHNNLSELLVFDYDENIEIAIDKYGQFHTIKNLYKPLEAVNSIGDDVKKLVSSIDDDFYTTSDYSASDELTDAVILEFPRPKNSNQAKLVINAKNTYLLDYFMGEFFDEFGDLYDQWKTLQKTRSAEYLRNWTLSQNIPLSLSVEKEGEWIPVDYYNIAGPIAMKKDVLAFNLNGTDSETLKLKLEFGRFLWDIDFTGIDYSDDIELDFECIEAQSAYDQYGRDVSAKLRKDDKKYYIQEEVGDQALIDFSLPVLNKNYRSIFLHTKGWYDIQREPHGSADRAYLEEFRQPGRFNQFINEFFEENSFKQ